MTSHNDAVERISHREVQFEAHRKRVGYLLAPLAFITILALPFDSLSPEAHSLAAVLAFAVIAWVCEPIPIPATAMLAPALCVVLGVCDARAALSGFGDPIIFLFLASFLLAAAMTKHGLDRRIAVTLMALPLIGDSTRRLLFVFGATAAALSMWISNTATTAMLIPIAIGIVREVETAMHRDNTLAQNQSSQLAPAMMLMTAYAASIGGLATPIGTPPNLVGIGIIGDRLNHRITFFEWMQFALPLTILLYLALYLVLVRLHRPEVSHLNGLSAKLAADRRALPAISQGERNTLIIFLVAITLWVAPGLAALALGNDNPLVATATKRIPETVAGVLAASLLFITPINLSRREFTLDWQDANCVDWGTLLMFGGGVSLGNLTFSTGLANTLGTSLMAASGLTGVVGICFVVTLLAILVSETTSNLASATMVVPVAIALAEAANVDPFAPALAACVGASFGFMLPISTAPNAIAYGTQRVSIIAMARAGIFFDIVGLAVVTAGAALIALAR